MKWCLLCVGLGLMLAMLWLAGASPAQANLLCVQPGNPGCYSTISAALAAAQAGDTIRVAAGTYIEYLTINKTLTLEGGWNSTFSARDPAVYTTTLQPPDTTFSVVYIDGITADPAAVAPTLEGFKITGGGGGNHGGGLRVVDSNAVISDNLFTGNIGYLLGGGIWVQRGAPIIANNRIENNVVTGGGSGGGVELENTQATLVGNIVKGNMLTTTVGYGGGIAVDDGEVKLINNTVISNVAATLIGGATEYGYGGGVSVRYAQVTLEGNTIQGNTASSIRLGTGGGVYIFDSNHFTLTNNTVTNNSAGFTPGSSPYLQGGGMFIEASTGLLTDTLLSGNRANRNTIFGNGGGLAAKNSRLRVSGGQVVDNSVSLNCEGYGGGIYLENSRLTLDRTRIDDNCAGNTPFYGKGGGLAFINSPYTMTNALVTNNYAFPNDTAVGGIYAGANSAGRLANNTIADNNGQGIRTGSPTTLTNSIIMGHTTGISLTVGATAIANNNDFYNNTTQARGFSLNVSNIVINPLLDGTYHIQPGSPVIDAGTRTGAPFHDFDDNPRPMKGTSGLYRFDIGADEFSGPAQTIRDLSANPADFTLIGPGNPQDNPGSDGSNDWIGFAVLGGDINGDQKADLAAGAPNLSSSFSGGVNDDGRVFALHNNGTRRTGILDLFSTSPGVEVRSWLHQQHVGQSLAAADLNGDGWGELVIGAGGAENFNVTGKVFIFAGSSSLTGTRTLSPTMQATYRILSNQNTSTFGEANALAAGQLNGSGPEDLVVAEGNATVLGRSQAGAVYVFFGSSAFPTLWNLGSLPASLTIFGPAANAQLGRVAVGDVNGDSIPDLAARSQNTLYVLNGPRSPGTIDLAVQTVNAFYFGLNDGRLALGDVDGDGKADLLVGDGTQVKVLRGGTAGTLSVMATFTGVSASSLQTLDWNQDGKAEIAIGDAANNRAFVIQGSAAISTTYQILDRADWVITGEKAGDQFGYSLGGGDLDDDHVLDLIVGSRSHSLNDRPDAHFNDAGAAYVFYGQGAGGLSLKVYLPLVLKNP